MSALISKGVESIGKRRLQPLHAGDEVASRSFERQMLVVVHHDSGVEQPFTALSGGQPTRFEGCFGFFFDEDPRPIIPRLTTWYSAPGNSSRSFRAARSSAWPFSECHVMTPSAA